VSEQTLNGRWQLRQCGTEDWIPARVPGGVHLDLMAAGRIPDPFVADNELRVMWVAESDWEYRRTFRIEPASSRPAEDGPVARRLLVFEGLDTLAEVNLNGARLGSADNMFRTWRWDVTDRLLVGENTLSIVFRSPVQYAREMEAKRHLDHPRDSLPGAPYLRKAPCHFGWDWGPKLPNVGLWKGVRLETWTQARIGDLRLGQKTDTRRAKARVTARVRVDRMAAGALTAVMSLHHPNGRLDTVQADLAALRSKAEAGSFAAESSTVDLSIEVADPELWWPNGLGGQPLYRVEVVLSAGERELDRRALTVGLRTLELRRKPDQWGESFTFVVNGVPVFAKGSNWIPADSFPARVGEAELERLIGAAAAANHNMIRVWGGGYYESEAFYDLCDRHGILVWQDFMFACSVYPLTDAGFVENLRAEATEQVRRLRHRACLALWCGNNEMERGWASWGWSRPETQDLKQAYLRFFGETLPAWVEAEDGATPYWPSSPSSGRPLEAPIGDRAGDEHEWVVWHALAPFESYKDSTWRFVSEFGFESLPAMATVAAFAPDPADWNLGSPMMDHHQRCASGNARILYYLAQHFRLPNDFPSMVFLSQVLHAEAMRVGVEHWRRQRARCGGALYWQLNDCWPVSSWASIDYFGRWKALHYVSRRFFEPVLLSCSVEPEGAAGGDVVAVAVTNDRPEPFAGDVRWTVERLSGSVVASGVAAVAAAGAATTRICAVDVAAATADRETRRTMVVVAELWAGGLRLSTQVVPLVRDKELQLAPPRIRTTVQVEAGGRAVARLRSASLARRVELSLEGQDVLFDDNYFDLPAGRDLEVGFELPAGWTRGRAQAALRIRSLIDTYLR
jgi:beta-mannosidase